MTSSFRGEAVGGLAKCHLVSQATESGDSQKSVVFTGYIPLRRIEPTFEFARKIRSFCQFLQSKTIKIELRVRISERGVGEGGWWTGIGGTNRFCVLRSLALSLTGAELYFSVQPEKGCLINGFNLNLLLRVYLSLKLW